MVKPNWPRHKMTNGVIACGQNPKEVAWSSRWSRVGCPRCKAVLGRQRLAALARGIALFADALPHQDAQELRRTATSYGIPKRDTATPRQPGKAPGARDGQSVVPRQG